jgi:hypothetical protein
VLGGAGDVVDVDGRPRQRELDLPSHGRIVRRIAVSFLCADT